MSLSLLRLLLTSMLFFLFVRAVYQIDTANRSLLSSSHHLLSVSAISNYSETVLNHSFLSLKMG